MSNTLKVVKPSSHGKIHAINNWPRGRGTLLCGRTYDVATTTEFAVALDDARLCGVCRSTALTFFNTVEAFQARRVR